jgi:hypothetical protein
MLGNIKINVAYEEILVYDVNELPIIYKPNGSDIDMFNDHDDSSYNRNTIENIEKTFDIKFPIKLNVTNPEELRNRLNIFYSYIFQFGPDYGVLKNGLITDFIEKNEKFIYPIVLADNLMFMRNNTIELPENLVDSIRKGNAKLVFSYVLEGHFGSTDTHYIWLSKLSKKYGFTKENIIILNGNLLSNQIQKELIDKDVIEDNFTVYPFSWFSYHTFFHHGGWKLNTDVKTLAYKSFFSYLNKNRLYEKKFHFLSFNRLSKIHRQCIFGELKTNPIFENKYIVSLGNIQTLRTDSSATFVKMINREIREDYKHNKNKLIEFFQNYDQNIHYTYDCDDFENNKAEVLNEDAHSKTFVNIVNESLTNENCVFFSEKIFKPIFMCQPFILFGNPYSLKKLKEIGYQTFDKWWDESYDLETDFTRRLEKIVDVMIEISSWDSHKLYEVTNEMEDVLFHNFNVLMSDSDIISLYKTLNTGHKKTKKLNLI